MTCNSRNTAEMLAVQLLGKNTSSSSLVCVVDQSLFNQFRKQFFSEPAPAAHENKTIGYFLLHF